MPSEARPGGLIACETIAAIVVHLRRVPEGGPNYTGTRIKPLCHAYTDDVPGWDTRLPLSAVTCRGCRERAKEVGRG